MLPFFFRHYDSLVARYFVFDNGSSDRSISLLKQHPKVTLGEFRTVGDSVIKEAPGFYETAWHRSRGEADWILIVNIDELLHHPDGKAYFKRSIRNGATAIVTTGYEMVSDAFPRSDQNLAEAITSGVRVTRMDKMCAFRPDAIRRLNYGPGRHTANPKGRVIYPPSPELSLLHYKYLGESYLLERYAELRVRIPDGDRQQGQGFQYFRSERRILEEHRSLMAQATLVPGLKSVATTGR